MFCIYLRTNSDLCHLQHKLIGFYNRDEKCLLRGTNWVFKLSSLRFVFKGLITHVADYIRFNGSFLGSWIAFHRVTKLLHRDEDVLAILSHTGSGAQSAFYSMGTILEGGGIFFLGIKAARLRR